MQHDFMFRMGRGRVDKSLLSQACDVPTLANPESSLNDLFSNLGSSKQREEDYCTFFEFVLTSHAQIYALQYRKCAIFCNIPSLKTVIGLLKASS